MTGVELFYRRFLIKTYSSVRLHDLPTLNTPSRGQVGGFPIRLRLRPSQTFGYDHSDPPLPPEKGRRPRRHRDPLKPPVHPEP